MGSLFGMQTKKRYRWAVEQILKTFDNIIFSDEASIEIQRTANKTYYKKGQVVTLRPRPKHPLKVSYISILCFNPR